MRKLNRPRFIPRLLAALSLLVLTGCSPKAAVPPELAEAKYECKEKSLKPGAEAVIRGSLKNKGGEFKGIKITLKGTAVSQGVLSMPAAARSKVECKYAAQKDLIMATAAPSFHKIDNETVEATLPEFECKGDTIELVLSMSASRNGRADLQIIVAPIAAPDKSSLYVLPIEVHQMQGIFMGT